MPVLRYPFHKSEEVRLTPEESSTLWCGRSPRRLITLLQFGLERIVLGVSSRSISNCWRTSGEALTKNQAPEVTRIARDD